jgi:hypothetical protein
LRCVRINTSSDDRVTYDFHGVAAKYSCQYHDCGTIDLDLKSIAVSAFGVAGLSALRRESELLSD